MTHPELNPKLRDVLADASLKAPQHIAVALEPRARAVWIASDGQVIRIALPAFLLLIESVSQAIDAAEALDPPYPLSGVYQCAYHRCRRVFLSKKTRVSGKLRFCCPEHGKRFYATRRMKEKSAAARAAKAAADD